MLNDGGANEVMEAVRVLAVCVVTTSDAWLAAAAAHAGRVVVPAYRYTEVPPAVPNTWRAMLSLPARCWQTVGCVAPQAKFFALARPGPGQRPAGAA